MLGQSLKAEVKKAIFLEKRGVTFIETNQLHFEERKNLCWAGRFKEDLDPVRSEWRRSCSRNEYAG